LTKVEEEDAEVQDPEIKITIFPNAPQLPFPTIDKTPQSPLAKVTKPMQPTLTQTAKTPPFPFPMTTKTLQLPKTTKTMQPPLLDESTVRINSCAAAGVQDPEIMGAIHESEDNDEEDLEIENALPGCLLQLRSSLLRDVSSKRQLSVQFDIVNVDRFDAPEYAADQYRAISISMVKPLPGEVQDIWAIVTPRYASGRLTTMPWQSVVPLSWRWNQTLISHRTSMA
jgi:hypothetical protein